MIPRLKSIWIKLKLNEHVKLRKMKHSYTQMSSFLSWHLHKNNITPETAAAAWQEVARQINS